MRCNECGKENVEDAIYCASCGKRLDGKMPCTSCGRLNEPTNTYCVFCGTRIDGKTVCAQCGQAYEGNFCPACGYGNKEKLKAAKMERNDGKGFLDKIWSLFGGVSIAFGVVLAMIFVFFIGLQAEGAGLTEKVNIFYYFGDAYEESRAMDLTGMTEWFAGRVESYTSLGNILGTVFSALILLSVLAFGTVAIIRYALFWAGKSKKEPYGWALAAIFSFFASAALFYCYNGASVRGTGNISSLLGSSVEIETSFNGVTVAGIVLCAIALGISLVFRWAQAGGSIWKVSFLPQTVCAILGTIFAGVGLILFKNALLGIEFNFKTSASATTANIGVSCSVGFLGMVTSAYTLLGVACTDTGERYYVTITKTVDEMAIYGILGQVFAIACVVFVTLALIKCVKGFDTKEASGVLWASLAAGSAVCLLVFTILSACSVEEIVDTLIAETGLLSSSGIAAYSVSGLYGVSIAALALSLLLLAVTITRSVIARKQKAET